MLLTVTLELIPSDLGGRRRPIKAVYRACWAYGDMTEEGETAYHDAPILLLDPDVIQPGGTGTAAIQPILPDAPGWEHVRVGHVLTMVEGSRVCGTATVKSIDAGHDPHWPAVASG